MSGCRNSSRVVVGENVTLKRVSIEIEFCSRCAKTYRVPAKLAAVGSAQLETNWNPLWEWSMPGLSDTVTLERGRSSSPRLTLLPQLPSASQLWLALN